MICIGFLAGVAFSAILVAGGVLYADWMDKRELYRDRGCISDVGDPDRQRDGMDRYIPTPEEIEQVLYVLRIGASNREKEVIDYLIDKEGEEDEQGDQA